MNETQKIDRYNLKKSSSMRRNKEGELVKWEDVDKIIDKIYHSHGDLDKERIILIEWYGRDKNSIKW